MNKVKAVLVVTMIMLGVTFCLAQKKENRKHRYKPKQIQTALDSICTEGYNLFLAETVNWIGSDSALAHYGKEAFGGNYIWQPDDKTWKAVYLDEKLENCIFELTLDIKTGDIDFNFTPRPITDTDIKQFSLRQTMLENGFNQYGESIIYAKNCGNPNVDFVRVDDNTIRMYILQGTVLPNLIPFGNDYSIDFDNEGNPLQFRKYHQSFIAITTTTEDGEKVESVYHSHLKDNPFITPTDICNFLLYRGDMKQTFVLSTALDGYIIYDAISNSAIFLTRKAANKILRN